MTPTAFDAYRCDPVKFIDDYLPLSEKGRPWRLSPHQRKVLKLALRWTAEGRLDLLRYLIWGEMKKVGRRCSRRRWACGGHSPTVDGGGRRRRRYEQARGRVFKNHGGPRLPHKVDESAEVPPSRSPIKWDPR